MAANFFKRYCESTTVHGFKYLVGKQSFAQKVFWALMIIFSIFCTLRLIAILIDQISRNPIVIYRDDTPIDVTKIPFPAFTMCDPAMFNDSQGYVSWQMNFVLPVIEVSTELGLCRTVNFCGQKNFLRDEVYEERIFGNSYNTYRVILPENETTPFMTNAKKLGLFARFAKLLGAGNVFEPFTPFQLFIHNPHELPTEDDQQFHMSKMDYDTFWITPQLTRIDETMIDMDPHERECFLPHEKNLTLYKAYNEANCKAECKSNFMAAECDCVPYNIIAKASTPVCNSTLSDKCATAAGLKFTSEISTKCSCLPPCEHLIYIVERTKADFTDQNPVQKMFLYASIGYSIKFKPGDHFPIVRRKHFTITEAFAFTGGLLGLFLGISVISLVEIINALLQPLFERLSTMLCYQKGPSRKNANRNRVFVAIGRAKSYFGFYLKESSIHSFNFIANAGNCCESMFWFTSFVLSMTGCVFMILQLYRTIYFKAVTLIIDDQIMDVSEIPFPAVTIFGSFPVMVKLWHPHVQTFAEYLNYSLNNAPLGYNSYNLSWHATAKNPTARIVAIGILCNNGLYYYPFFNHLNTTDHEKYIVEEIKHFTEVDWFKKQKGSFGKFPNAAPFSEILTIRGAAFSFNILDFNEMFDIRTVSSDFHYEQNVVLGDHLKKKESKFPWHASVAESLELELVVNQEAMIAYTETFSVHPTDEFPMVFQPEEIFAFAGKRKIEILITPSVIKSDDSLKSLEPSDRMCFFEGERKLQFFKVYTQHNCEIECYSKHLTEACNCSAFDIVRGRDTRVCSYITARDSECTYYIDENFRNFKQTEQLSSCSCLPTCESIIYSVDVRERKLQESEFDNITKLSFKFGKEDFRPMRRTRPYTMIDFLSYVGGVLGLFAGISVLSFFEIVYFFILRVFSNFFVQREAKQHSIVVVRPAN